MTSRIFVLEKENSELRDKLGLNSTNSSLPPSKDLYKIKDKTKPKSIRKIGAQPGHTGTNRKLNKPVGRIKWVKNIGLGVFQTDPFQC